MKLRHSSSDYVKHVSVIDETADEFRDREDFGEFQHICYDFQR